MTEARGSANQWTTGFFMITASVMKELITSTYAKFELENNKLLGDS